MRPSLLDHLDDALPVVLAQSQQFLENANKVLNAQNRDNVGKTLANLEAASARMSNSLGQLQKLLSDDNVASFSAASREAGVALLIGGGSYRLRCRALEGQPHPCCQLCGKTAKEDGEEK